ncbi:translation initiation factor IF-2-like [Ursus maritimus]|uniref:Translation initiation factor IF-2-like n=1 Tax=Ursus maritimus TaxID=29073 RepID=A0A8M1FJV2_URSMA|nr:translation initiation factor IF-2-like [Ursus maritimus]
MPARAARAPAAGEGRVRAAGARSGAGAERPGGGAWGGGPSGVGPELGRGGRGRPAGRPAEPVPSPGRVGGRLGPPGGQGDGSGLRPTACARNRDRVPRTQPPDDAGARRLHLRRPDPRLRRRTPPTRHPDPAGGSRLRGEALRARGASPRPEGGVGNQGPPPLHAPACPRQPCVDGRVRCVFAHVGLALPRVPAGPAPVLTADGDVMRGEKRRRTSTSNKAD